MLSRKSKNIYKFLIAIIRETVLHMNLQHEFAWETATFDFETGALRALGECISFVELHGCHFHFCQSIFRHLGLMGLKMHYMDTDFPLFAFFVRCVFALAFLPIERIQMTFHLLVECLEQDYDEAGLQYPASIINFVRYIHDTWVSDTCQR